MKEDVKLVKGKELGDVRHETLNRMFWNTVKKYPHVEAVKYKVGDKEEFWD